MYTTSNNKNTYEELELFQKHGASFKGVYLNFSFRRDGKDHWAQTNFDDSLVLTREQVESQIDFMRAALSGDGDFNTSLQLGAVVFPTGQAFEDWMTDKQLQTVSLKQEEIIQ